MRLQEILGFPSQCPGGETFQNSLFEIVSEDLECKKYAIYFFSNWEKGAIDYLFSRIEIAKMDGEFCSVLYNHIKTGLEERIKLYLKDKTPNNNTLGKEIRVFLEILSRLSIRLEPEKVLKEIHFSTQITAKIMQLKFTFVEPFAHLVDRLFDSFLLSNVQEAVGLALKFPLLCEVYFDGKQPFKNDGPDPMNSISVPSITELMSKPDLQTRLHELLDIIGSSNSIGRSAAMVRLLKLGSLEELDAICDGKLADAVWRQDNVEETLNNESEIYKGSLLKFPFKKYAKISTSEAAKKIFEKLLSENLDDTVACELSAIFNLDKLERSFFKEKALVLVEKCLNWQPKSTENDWPFCDTKRSNARSDAAISYLLTNELFPSIVSLNDHLQDLWRSKLNDLERRPLLLTLHEFGRLVNQAEAADLMMLNNFSHDKITASHSITATGQVFNGSGKWDWGHDIDNITDELFDLANNIVTICLQRKQPGLYQAVSVLRILFETGVISILTTDDRAVRSVNYLIDYCSVENAENIDNETSFSHSLILVECLKISKCIVDQSIPNNFAKKFLDNAVSHPLPELRNLAISYAVKDRQK